MLAKRELATILEPSAEQATPLHNCDGALVRTQSEGDVASTLVHEPPRTAKPIMTALICKRTTQS
jgi:hypothetical protein